MLCVLNHAFVVAQLCIVSHAFDMTWLYIVKHTCDVTWLCMASHVFDVTWLCVVDHAFVVTWHLGYAKRVVRKALIVHTSYLGRRLLLLLQKLHHSHSNFLIFR